MIRKGISILLNSEGNSKHLMIWKSATPLDIVQNSCHVPVMDALQLAGLRSAHPHPSSFLLDLLKIKKLRIKVQREDALQSIAKLLSSLLISSSCTFLLFR